MSRGVYSREGSKQKNGDEGSNAWKAYGTLWMMKRGSGAAERLD